MAGPDRPLSGQAAIVTGAAAGIGQTRTAVTGNPDSVERHPRGAPRNAPARLPFRGESPRGGTDDRTLAA